MVDVKGEAGDASLAIEFIKRLQDCGAGPLPPQIHNIEVRARYPIPVIESLQKNEKVILNHKQLEGASLDCIQLRFEGASFSIEPPTYCLDQGRDILREVILGDKQRVIYEHVEDFQGDSIARFITVKEAKSDTAVAEVIGLDEVSPSKDIFVPSPDMNRVTDLHTFKVTKILR